MHAGVVMLDCSRGRLLLRRSRCGTRCRLANRELHGGDLLQLVDDDFLRDAPQLFVLAVTQFADRHVDRALMMGAIMATKSRSMSPVGLIAMSSIILIIAASFSFQNGASSTATAVAGGAFGWASCASTCEGRVNAIRRRAPKTTVPKPGLGSFPDSGVEAPRNDGRCIVISTAGCCGCDVWRRVLFHRAAQNSGAVKRKCWKVQ